MSGPPTIYVVAGEPSGDRLGASLMRALRCEAPQTRFRGVGGLAMAAQGLESRFEMRELSVMGLAEIVPRIPRLMRRIRETAADVLASAPDALVTIDSPGFGLRVAERVRRRAPAIRTIQYVAPSVWAWRPARAKRMARFIDHVLTLLPFEPPYMTAAGMTCDFVGHPVVETPAVSREAAAAFRARAGLQAEETLLLVAPGSRAVEVRRMMPVFIETLGRILPRAPGIRVVIPVAEGVELEIEAAAERMDPKPLLVFPEEGEATRQAAFAAAEVALVKSGTAGLELAAASTPMVSAYRTSWATAAIVRRLVRVDTASLVNLVGGEKIVPEFIQEHCVSDRIAPALIGLLENGVQREAQRVAFDRVLAALGRGGEPPSRRAARSVLQCLGRS